MRFPLVLAASLALGTCHTPPPTGTGGDGGTPAACTYAPASPLPGRCPGAGDVPLWPCTMPGAEGALDPACGYLAETGLPGAAYCSAACGSCPACRMRGVQGEPCEVGTASSCAPGLACVGGVCEVAQGAIR
jgi:hypothetical protein